jgi:hypothetical protein
LNTPQSVRIFDPDTDSYANHWVVQTEEGTFLVPACRGGWTKRRPFSARIDLIPLDWQQVEYVWDVLVHPTAQQARR